MNGFLFFVNDSSINFLNCSFHNLKMNVGILMSLSNNITKNQTIELINSSFIDIKQNMTYPFPKFFSLIYVSSLFTTVTIKQNIFNLNWIGS